MTPLVGLSWRPERVAEMADLDGLECLEVMFEDLEAFGGVPAAIAAYSAAGMPIVLHATSLSLGTAQPMDIRRLDTLARFADKLDALLVSDHVAFTRAGEIEGWTLLPLPRTELALSVLVENVETVRRVVDRPVALENITYHVTWPDDTMSEVQFLTAVCEAADVGILLDVENVRINGANHGYDPMRFIAELPPKRIAYLHVAGGVEHLGVHRDTHSQPVSPATHDLLAYTVALADPPMIVLEWDQDVPGAAQLGAELASLHGTIRSAR